MIIGKTKPIAFAVASFYCVGSALAVSAQGPVAAQRPFATQSPVAAQGPLPTPLKASPAKSLASIDPPTPVTQIPPSPSSIPTSGRGPSNLSVPSRNRRIAAVPHPIHTSKEILSPDAKLLAENIGVLSTLNEISRLRQSASGPLDYTTQAGLRLMFLRQSALEVLTSAGYEVRSSVNSIDREVAEAEEVRAVLAERRDRAIRLNTYADFISGGVTGLVAGGLKLGDVSHFSPDIIDTSEGLVQTGLSAWAFQQQRGEKRLESGVPNLLAMVFDLKMERPYLIEPIVWSFFNADPISDPSGLTRRQLLREHWLKRNLCFTHRGHRGPKHDRVKHLTGTHPEQTRMTIDVLEDRLAMFADLRSTLTQMDCLLLELAEVIRGIRRVD